MLGPPPVLNAAEAKMHDANFCAAVRYVEPWDPRG